MKKYLVIQSFVGKGSWLNDNSYKDLKDLYESVLIPSYAKYCKKHGYKHVVYREQISIIEQANKKYGNDHGNLYHQYISALNHIDDDIDYFVFPDADFFVTDFAKPFPETNYLAGTPWEAKSLIKRGKDPKTFKAVFGGIQIMTKEAAIDLATYLVNRFNDYILYDKHLQMHPNMLTVGDWINENGIEPEYLSFDYNYILDHIEDRPWTLPDSRVGFWHLYRKNKRQKLNYVRSYGVRNEL